MSTIPCYSILGNCFLTLPDSDSSWFIWMYIGVHTTPKSNLDARHWFRIPSYIWRTSLSLYYKWTFTPLGTFSEWEWNWIRAVWKNNRRNGMIPVWGWVSVNKPLRLCVESHTTSNVHWATPLFQNIREQVVMILFINIYYKDIT